MESHVRTAAIGLLVAIASAAIAVAGFVALGGDMRQTARFLLERRQVDRLIERADAFERPEPAKPAASSRPNVIVVLTDDQHVDTLPHMPFLWSEVQARGTLYPNAVVTNPECCPFRASFLSGGWHTHDTGVLSNGGIDGGLRNFNEGATLATALSAVGYRTGFVGKYMHGYRPGYVPPGWSSFVANNRGGMIRDYFNLFSITRGDGEAGPSHGSVSNWFLPRREYITNFQFREALSFIREGDDAPLFLVLSLYAPHVPFIAERESDWEGLEALDVACVDDFESASERPAWMAKARDAMADERSCGVEKFRGQIALLRSVDRNLVGLLEAVETELERDSLVIFTSDNGLELGRDYIYSDKGTPYEGAIRVPLAILGDRRPAEIDPRLVAVNLDVPATILALAGVDSGTDGVPLNAEPEETAERLVLLENYGYLEYKNRRFDAGLPSMVWSGVRSENDKLIEYADGYREYFDLSTDPDELSNRIGDPANARRVTHLSAWLETRRGVAVTSPNVLRFAIGEDVDFK